MSDSKEPSILPEALTESLCRAQFIMVMTGAGVSAESGVPTFRDAQEGLWAKYRPEDLASPQGFARDPAMVWDWYQWRREQIRAVAPNPGHRALAEMEQIAPEFLLVTQNVDGLHQAAGSDKIIELHGNIHRNICSETHQPIDDEWIADHPGRPPPSPHAHDAYARPDVVWFGEMLPESALKLALSAVTRCDVMIVAGTSGLVEPAASLPRWAHDHGAIVIDINPEATPISRLATHYLPGASAQWLPVLRAALK